MLDYWNKGSSLVCRSIKRPHWVETNPSNFCICPMDIRFAVVWSYADGVDTDVK